MSGAPRTLYDKLWDAHDAGSRGDGNHLLYIDRVILHEVTSAQAFEGLHESKRPLWRGGTLFAVADHQVPTTDRASGINGFSDPIARLQVETLDANCSHHGVEQFLLNDLRQGIVHVVGPEQGISLPGMSVVCGDSHTSTHGALAALAQGIGTSELEHVFATQCLPQNRCKNLRVMVNGQLPIGVVAKDLALHIIHLLGISGGTGHAIEYAGEAVQALDMAGRFTLCNMSIEAGARTGLIAYDQITEDYVKERPRAPKGAAWEAASQYWREHLHSDTEASFDLEISIDATEIEPQVSWGTKPDQVAAVNSVVPQLDDARDAAQRRDWESALAYMDLKPGQNLNQIRIDQVFIGSCTNARIEDLRAAALVVRGRKKVDTVKRALVVPGSGLIKAQAETEGLDQIFMDAGFEWRDAGCSMCNAMNPDQLEAGERCASTSNRNFESRQGRGGRTHLLSPAMAAAAAVTGHLTDVRQFT
ncbi:MAG: 3-isopropylmalate dehydratase large subunit [Oceanococcus sp.]